jgi:peptidoglycan/LPS O-acetylase OafA/YrhL
MNALGKLSNDKNRYKSLDSLRGIAAICVLITHFTNLYDHFYHYDFPISSLYRLGGSFGVHVFFTLSGLVIYYSVNNKSSTVDFLKKRLIRLYPTYWVCLIITFFAVLVFGLSKHQVSSRDALFGLTMLPQLFGALKVDNSYWTLVPEFFFYIMMAALLLIGKVSKIYWIAPIWIVLSFIHIHVYHIKVIGLVLNLEYGVCFLSGMLIYCLKQDKNQFLLWLYLMLCFFLYVSKDHFDLLNYVSIALVFFIFIAFVFNNLDFLQNRVLLFLGYISYPLYLIHQNIGYIIINTTRDYFGNLGVIILPTLFSVALASVIAFYIEKPAMNILKRKLL